MQNIQAKGKFITFEGGDGAGKSTQALLVKNYLIQKGVKVLSTREPGGTEFGESFREIFLKYDTDPMTQLLSMMAARNQHIEEVIKPAINAGITVVCDRFVDSTACYQTNNGGITIQRVYELHKNLLNDFLPDITILINLHPETAIARVRERNLQYLDKIEAKSMEFHFKIYEKYLKIAQMFPNRIKVIDGTQEMSKIHDDIATQLELLRVVA
jgi:dTMP kinase